MPVVKTLPRSAAGAVYRLLRRALCGLPALLLATSAMALDPPPAPPKAATGETAASTAATPRSAPPATAPADTKPAPAHDDKSTGPTPERFTPSEKVRADFAVSFPADI